MRRSPHTLFLPGLLALVAALVLGACGGGDEAASDEDVDALLEQTFSGDKKIESGVVDLRLTLDTEGGGRDGSFDITLGGPFQSAGDKQLPQFAMTAKIAGQGQNIEAGATSTGDRGFIAFNGQQYQVSDEVFAEFKRGYEQAQAQQSGRQDQSLASLGIDPRRWLTDAQNEGEAEVGGEDTIKITGGVDVGRLLDDVNNALRKAAELGATGAGQGQLPERLTEEQKRQAQDAVKNLGVEIYTGADDKTLRRMVVDADLEASEDGAQQAQSAAITLDLTLTEVNEDQEIEAPADARPFDELLHQLGGLGLGGLGGAQSGGGGSGGASGQALEQYSECIRAAGNDAAKAQQCADLLTAP